MCTIQVRDQTLVRQDPLVAAAVALGRAGERKAVVVELMHVGNVLGLSPREVLRGLRDLQRSGRISLACSEPAYNLRVLRPPAEDELEGIFHTLVETMLHLEQAQLRKLEFLQELIGRATAARPEQEGELPSTAMNRSIRRDLEAYFEQTKRTAAEPEPVLADLPARLAQHGVSRADADRLRSDIRTLLVQHSDRGQTLFASGREVARIFHGIASPCFSGGAWYSHSAWRRHQNVDFHLLRLLATDELIKHKQYVL